MSISGSLGSSSESLQKVEFLRRRSNLAFVFISWFDFDLILTFSDNSDGPGDLGKVF